MTPKGDPLGNLYIPVYYAGKTAVDIAYVSAMAVFGTGTVLGAAGLAVAVPCGIVADHLHPLDEVESPPEKELFADTLDRYLSVPFYFVGCVIGKPSAAVFTRSSRLMLKTIPDLKKRADEFLLRYQL